MMPEPTTAARRQRGAEAFRDQRRARAQRQRSRPRRQAAGFRARTKALMNLPSTCGAMASASSLRRPGTRGRPRCCRRASARCRCPRSPPRRASSRYSSSSSAPATQPTQSSMLRRICRRHLAAHDDVGDGEAAARLEHAEGLAQHAVLVGREVDDAVGDDDVHRVVGQRDVLDLALEELDVRRRRPSAGSRGRAPASRRSCRGRRPCPSDRRAGRRAGRRCRRRSRGRAPISPGASSASAVGLPQPSEASTASSGRAVVCSVRVQVSGHGIAAAARRDRAAAPAFAARHPERGLRVLVPDDLRDVRLAHGSLLLLGSDSWRRHQERLICGRKKNQSQHREAIRRPRLLGAPMAPTTSRSSSIASDLSV